MRWIAQLTQSASSLGGAHPKASVIDDNKILYITKFPSRKDDYDAGLWEHFSHLLAKEGWCKYCCDKSHLYKRKIPYFTFLKI